MGGGEGRHHAVDAESLCSGIRSLRLLPKEMLQLEADRDGQGCPVSQTVQVNFQGFISLVSPQCASKDF